MKFIAITDKPGGQLKLRLNRYNSCSSGRKSFETQTKAESALKHMNAEYLYVETCTECSAYHLKMIRECNG